MPRGPPIGNRGVTVNGRALSSPGSSDGGTSPSEPPSSGDWTLAFEDKFDQGSLDTDRWGIGFGWGDTASGDDADVHPDRVWVDDVNDQLVLEVKSEGDGSTVTQGAINSQDGSTSTWYSDDINPPNGYLPSPPVYMESRINPIGREGVLPAWWCKPNNEDWPPEIDYLEIFHDGDSWDTDIAHFNIHYDTNATCGGSNNTSTGSHDHDAGRNICNEFNTYGTAWKSDQVEFYFNDTLIHTETNSTAMSALTNTNCLPHYIMYSNHVNRVGTADLSTAWTEEHRVDWIRAWEG